MSERLTVEVREEDGMLWASIAEVPGCLASGRDVAELEEALAESMAMCGVTSEPIRLRAPVE